MLLSPRLLLITASMLLPAGIGQALAARPAAVPKGGGQPVPVFETEIRPILKAYCFDCHGGEEKIEANLDLRLKRFMERGGQSGRALVPGDAAKSLLLKRVKGGSMPPVGKKVPAEQVALLERWIAAGALTRRAEPMQLPPGIDLTPEERAYWFYQPIRRWAAPTLTASAAKARVRTPIDAFVLKKLQENGLTFAPEADRLTLIRRASFDLTGLPPSQAEIEAFLSDASEGAYERMLDRLLASPHYGERWGRHWLDVAGYADSDGNGSDDTPRAFAYKYRDYVIRSLNADKPFDQFITEQLAGDELVPRPWTNLKPEQIEKLTATGFLRTAVDAAGGGGDPLTTNQVLADTIKIVSSSLLGLTVGCAQCHDHRYDPIKHTDYFRVRAILEPALNPKAWKSPGQRLVSLYTEAERARAAQVEAEAQNLQAAYNEKQTRMVEAAFEAELLKFPEDQRSRLRDAIKAPVDKRTAEQKQLVANNPKLLISPGVLYQYNQPAADELTRDMGVINAKRAERPVEEFVSVLTEEPGVVPVTHLFYRGDHRAPKQAIAPGDLTIAAPDGSRIDIPEKDPAIQTTGRRLAWAKHLMSGGHPLVGRVLANRVWLNHFGRGLVDTPGDFGKLGVKPTHPELLDWLASALATGDGGWNDGPGAVVSAEEAANPGNWRLKRFHKLIMTSTVYRQASAADARTRKIDSDGSLYSRFPVRRLDAETLRDRILAVSGRLDRTLFGPPVPLVEDAVGQVAAKDNSPRRGLYLQARRSKPVSFLVAFDAPVMTVNCERRTSTNGAPQALMLMNSEFILVHAEQFAKRLQAEAPGDLPTQVRRGWEAAYNRPASPIELGGALDFLKRHRERTLSDPKPDAAKADLSALTHLCQQLLSSNEFLYVD